MWTARRIEWRCAPLGSSTAVSSWRRSAAAIDYDAEGAKAWEASFCEAVMLAKAKEEAKRERERRPSTSRFSCCRRRRGRRDHETISSHFKGRLLRWQATGSSLSGKDQARVDGALNSTRASKSCQHFDGAQQTQLFARRVYPL